VSQIDYLNSCIAFRNTTLELQNRSVKFKSFLQALHLLRGLKSNVTSSSCSFLAFGNTVTRISNYSARCVSPIGSLCHYTCICNPPFLVTLTVVLSQYTAVLVRWWILGHKTIFGKLLNVGKFTCTLNFLLLAMDVFLSGYKRKDRDKEAGWSKDEAE
jgi:hypothetical protein